MDLLIYFQLLLHGRNLLLQVLQAAELQAVQALIGGLHLGFPVASFGTAPKCHCLLLSSQLCQSLVGLSHLHCHVGWVSHTCHQ